MQYSQPLVSVVILSYNHEQFVKDSIQSVIDQDYENIELIIIDDGSKDSSINIIKSMYSVCEERFARFEFRHRENKGLCATLNEALEWCEGEYFSPLASDDIALSKKIRYLVDKIHNSEYAVVFGNIECIGNIVTIQKRLKQTEHTFNDLIMQKNIPSAPAALFRTQDLIDIGGYTENIRIEDWYMWLKLTNNSKKIVSYSEIVCLYRRHDNNMTNDIRFMHSARQDIIELYSDNIMYERAISNNLLIKARDTAFDGLIEPLKLLLESRRFDRESIIVLIKIITPKNAIKIKRKIHKILKI